MDPPDRRKWIRSWPPPKVWHPQQFGAEIRIVYREHRRGEDVVVFEKPNTT